jgi:hypothetical protein
MKILRIKENESHRRHFENLFVLKGLGHKVNFFGRLRIKKQILSVHALMFFTIFCFLVDEKIKVLAFSFEIAY